VWESNLLSTDTSSAYEEAFGLSWKVRKYFELICAAQVGIGISAVTPYLYKDHREGKREKKSWYQYIFFGRSAAINLGSCKRRSLFSTWLTRIVINSALMIRRTRTGHVETSLDEIMNRQPERLRHGIVNTAHNSEEVYASGQTSDRFPSKPATSTNASRSASTLLSKRVVRC
jgi:hypothetical protein